MRRKKKGGAQDTLGKKNGSIRVGEGEVPTKDNRKTRRREEKKHFFAKGCDGHRLRKESQLIDKKQGEGACML